MLRTVKLANFISVQGIFVRFLPDGRMTVRVGRKKYTGTPIAARHA